MCTTTLRPTHVTVDNDVVEQNFDVVVQVLSFAILATKILHQEKEPHALHTEPARTPPIHTIRRARHIRHTTNANRHRWAARKPCVPVPTASHAL